MTVQLGVAATLAIAALVLLLGRSVIVRVALLSRYAVPEPVVGGILAALLIAALHGAGIRVDFDVSLQPGLMLVFFATIGLAADARALAKGGLPLVLFTLCVVGMLVMENVIGIGAAKAMGIDPVIGLVAGSVTMAGGHGTGAAWGQRFVDIFGVTEAPAVGLATATFGLLLGGIIGGPVAMRLIRRLEANGAPLGVGSADTLRRDAADVSQPLSPERLTASIMLIAASAAIGTWIAQATESAAFTLPSFVWTLLAGTVLRNLLASARLHSVDGQALSFVGAVALSLFLAMALMSLRLWEIASLAVPMFVILALQATAVAAYTTLVTFRVLGANYEAAVLVAGQCGFGLGATPTAIANMQAVCLRHGPAPLAYLLVPVVGAFLIDLANAIVIGLFVNILPAIRG